MIKQIIKKSITSLLALAIFLPSFALAQMSGLPTVSVANVGSITTTSAVLSGTVNPQGENATVWYETMSSGSLGRHSLPATTSAVNTVPYTLTNLSPNTVYSVRIVASTRAGITNGSWKSFTTANTTNPTPTSRPTITNTNYSNLTSTSARLTGRVNPNGSNTNAWFETMSSGSLGIQNIGNSTSEVSLNDYTLSNLNPNTNYSIRVVASNANGITNGNWVSFTTPNNTNPAPTTLPSVTHTSYTNAGSTSVTLRGRINPNGGSNTTAWFETMSSGSLGIQTNLGSGTSDVWLNDFSLTNLNPNTTYSFRVVVSTNRGITNGPWTSFTTSNNSNPNPTNPSISSISPSNMTRGQGGDIRIYGSNLISPIFLNMGNDININSWSLLNSGEIRANITVNSGASTGSRNISVTSGNYTTNSLSFTVNNTSRSGGGGGGGSYRYPISVNTNNPTNVTGNSIVLNGSINNNNYSSTAYFEYGTNSNLNSYQETNRVNLLPAYGDNNFSQTIYNLNPNTTYYYRIVGTNSNNSAKGSIYSFRTRDVVLENSVKTIKGDSVTSSSGRFNALFVNNNRKNSIAYFEYGNTPNLGYKTEELNLGSDSATFSTTITNLSPNTLYYFRPVVINDGQYIYGNKFVIETLSAGTVNNTTNNTPRNEINKVDQNTVTVDDEGNLTNIDPNLQANAFLNLRFLPQTLFGWILLFIAIMILIILGKRYSERHN
jgi:hypothetical protein